MLKVTYQMNGQPDPNEDLEDEIDAHMAEHGMDRCGDGGISGDYRELEYEAENSVEELYMSNTANQALISLLTGEELTFDFEPWDED